MGINLRVGGLQTLWIEKRLGDLRLAPANESMPMGPVIVVHDHSPWFSGLCTQGKVYNRDLHHNAAWLSLDGVDQDGFLNTKGLQIKEGDTIAVEITGEARGRGEGKAVPVKICNKIHQSGHVCHRRAAHRPFDHDQTEPPHLAIGRSSLQSHHLHQS